MDELLMLRNESGSYASALDIRVKENFAWDKGINRVNTGDNKGQ